MPQPETRRILVWPVKETASFDVSADLERLVPALREFGSVHVETDPQRLRQLARQTTGQPTVIVTSAPLHKIPADLGAPVVPVVGWPYDRIPAGQGIAGAIAAHGLPFDRCIALNQHSADVLRRDLGDSVAVHVVRAPASTPDSSPGAAPGVISVPGVVIDSRALEITEATIRHADPAHLYPSDPWDGRPMWLRFSLADDDRGLLVGFYNSEVWGTWSRIRDPWVLLPRMVSGDIRLSLDAHGFAANAGRRIKITLGGAEGWIQLPKKHGHLIVELRGAEPSNVLQFHDLDVTNAGTNTDIRTMGIALGSVRLTRPGVWGKVRDRLRPHHTRPRPDTTLELHGVVYVATADPRDELSNWSRLITAFCIAFRDESGATLVLQFPGAPMASFFAELQLTLHRIGGFDCRVVVLTGELEPEAQAQLRDRADFALTASLGAASALDVADAMAAGAVPIAPDHTAFADLALRDTGFAVRSTSGPRGWPLDPERPIAVLAQRPDFDSLVDCLHESYRIATTDHSARRSKAERARQHACSQDELPAVLAETIAGVVDASV